MSPCTAKEVRELNTQLMEELTHELSSRLCRELRAQLDAAFTNKSGRGTPASKHPVLQGGPHIEPTTSQATDAAPIGVGCSGKLNSQGAVANSCNETASADQWSGTCWASTDETEWLLSKPFGPTEIPGLEQHNGTDCRSVRLAVDLVDDWEDCSEAKSSWRFVEARWFQGLSAFIIILNTVLALVEINNPSTHSFIHYPNELFLAFYVLELLARSCFYGRQFLRGPTAMFWFNLLDVALVVAGVADEWVLPLVPGLLRMGHLSTVLQMFRMLRLFRVLKIIRVFLSSDLSWTEEPAFQSSIGVVITLNAVLMGVETDVSWPGWFWIEQAFLVFYVFELCVRLKGAGVHFFAWDNPDFNWNWLDVMIVGSSTLDSWVGPLAIMITERMFVVDVTPGRRLEVKACPDGVDFGQAMMFMRMLKLLRILRIARLVKAFRPLYILVTSVCAAVQGVVWVLLLTVATLYATGIFATRLIGHAILFSDPEEVDPKVRVPFRTVADSMFTLFRFMSGSTSASEADALDTLMDSIPTLKFAFVFFMVTSSWTLLSILTAVVSETMISTTGFQEYELKLASDEEDHSKHVRELRELFRQVDTTEDGSVTVEELLKYLENKNNAMRTSRMCRVPVRDVVAVLSTVEAHGERITKDEFVEYMSDVGAPVTEKSIMKLEARLRQLQRSMAALLGHFELQPLRHSVWTPDASCLPHEDYASEGLYITRNSSK